MKDIAQLKFEVEAFQVGTPFDEVIAVEVFGMFQGKGTRKVKDAFTKKVIGQSKWRAKDGTPIFLPKFSTVPFIGCLMLEDLDRTTNIERAEKGQYNVQFLGEGLSGVPIQGESFTEAVCKAALFEARYKRAMEGVNDNVEEGGEPGSDEV